MRPFPVPVGITVTPARVTALLLLLVAAAAAAAAVWMRRARGTDAEGHSVDSPLERLRGFHIFGPDDDEAERVHVPKLVRPVSSVPPPPSAPQSTADTSASPAPAAAPAPPVPAAVVRRTVIPPAAPAAAPTPTPAVTLPGVPVSPRRPRSNGSRPRIEEQLGRDILLVEDDETIASMYLMLLTAKGYTARHARDGVEGIAMVRKERPALILLDMLMPRMDGLQFLEALRGWPKTAGIPVVVLSNVADHSLVERALALGAVEYLIKAQTRPQVLVGALPHWLRGNRALTA